MRSYRDSLKPRGRLSGLAHRQLTFGAGTWAVRSGEATELLGPQLVAVCQ